MVGWDLNLDGVQGPTALTACPPGDSSNTRLLILKDKYLGKCDERPEGEGGKPEPKELPQFHKHNRKWRRLWKGSGEWGCGMWGHPHAWPLNSAQSCTGRPRGGGTGLDPEEASPHSTASLQTTESKTPHPTFSVQMGKLRL